MVHDFMETEGVVQLPDPPYSPDMSPGVFFLFALLKSNLSGRRYESLSSLGSAILSVYRVPQISLHFMIRSYIPVKGEHFNRLKCMKVR